MDWKTLTKIGTLSSTIVRGKEILSFEYAKLDLILPLDPALKLYPGKHYLPEDKANFGAFLDSSPDRWGRTLIQRREALQAKEDKRAPKTLFETDYLLGVYDPHRMGALRFKCADGPFLDDNPKHSTPPWTSLRELEAISFRLEQDNIEQHPDYSQWLQMLFLPGSSLGGARPKATIKDTRGHLWIAKFPSRYDTLNVGAWEHIATQLAKECGILVPHTQVKKIGSTHHTFLSKRFDRQGTQRIPFCSAMTLLDYTDGQEGASYLEFIDLLTQQGANPQHDLEELWKRIVFSICISNTDDHLRNHGFALTPDGWRLSPAYDLNPNPYGKHLSLNISETSNEKNLALALDVCERFNVSLQSSKKTLANIKNKVQKWPLLAKQLKLPTAEQDQLAQAFIQ